MVVRKPMCRGHRDRCWPAAVAAALAWLFLPCHCAKADEITVKDLQVLGRALSFMENGSSGTFELAIIFVPTDAESLRQARVMRDMLGDGLAAGKLLLRARLVAADELPKLDHVGALFIVPAAMPFAATIASAGRRLHVPTVSTDAGCAEAGYCVVAFHSEPTVEILYSGNAAASSGVRFTPAFRMLVKQV